VAGPRLPQIAKIDPNRNGVRTVNALPVLDEMSWQSESGLLYAMQINSIGKAGSV